MLLSIGWAEASRRRRGGGGGAEGSADGTLDHLGFGFAFYPLLNPHFDGENPVRMG